jgi:MFS transporter, SHS family, sialic acid transporter
MGITVVSFYGLLPLYLPELFPTRVRATGTGVAFNSGRIIAAIGALTTGSMIGFFNGDYGKAITTITLVYIIGMIVIWFAPETKGKPLPA